MVEKKGRGAYWKSVPIPHLRHTVHFADMSTLQGIEVMGGGYTAVINEDETIVFIDKISESVKLVENAPMIAHELMHVIQILCEKMKMQIENEKEHTAYLMSYLFDELLK